MCFPFAETAIHVVGGEHKILSVTRSDVMDDFYLLSPCYPASFNDCGSYLNSFYIDYGHAAQIPETDIYRLDIQVAEGFDLKLEMLALDLPDAVDALCQEPADYLQVLHGGEGEITDARFCGRSSDYASGATFIGPWINVTFIVTHLNPGFSGFLWKLSGMVLVDTEYFQFSH